ncbi:Eukaryotic translation initiation factor 4E-1 [Geodia barretti]|uniref:Eukaryotic translation initiation factor 4E-1 n=1 Tax=Geodia barretti TaxID=519541 RepID=A0AA35SC25_GEOBA|nr:Eukaryotic translation initiation factor 4E-1 [Geodia barretti]
MREEWPTLEAVETNNNEQGNEDEWPDLHSPDVKIQPTELFTNSGPNGEVRVQNLEPHPQNAAAAYPHMIHASPYPMGWPPHFLSQVHVPVTTTGPFNYYHFHHQTGFYPPPPHGPAFSWPGSHVGLPPVPIPYTHSGSEDDSGCVDLSKTPPTSLGDEEGELNVERLEKKVEDGEEDRLGEGEKEGERGGGGEEVEEVKDDGDLDEVVRVEGGEGEKEGEEVEEVKDDGDLDEVVSGEGVEGGEGEEGDEETGEAVVERDLSCDVCPGDIAAVPSNLPLESTWVMWYDRITGNTRNCRSDYRSSLQNIHTMSSVEDFWRLYNNIRQPRGLERNSNYHFFKVCLFLPLSPPFSFSHHNPCSHPFHASIQC